ncbi:MAG TPA: FHA domain-containing protein [Firmicutes bacterium]|nr:FHA domain-containing protein [Candidatus Fermentithermobacillaceae bacterium]
MSDTLVKYCPVCGAENPRYAAYCASCGDADLSTVPAEKPRKQAASLVLESLKDPSISFTVLDGQTVGRGDSADVVLTGVPDLDAISRKHAVFEKQGAQWFVRHVGGTNFIKVDGVIHTGQEPVEIHDGSIVALTLTEFRVKLGEV